MDIHVCKQCGARFVYCRACVFRPIRYKDAGFCSKECYEASKKVVEPTVEEIAKELGIKKEEVVLALESIVEPVSLYEPIYNDGGDTIYVMDQIGSNETDESWLDEILLRQAIKDLNSREKKILFLRFMQGKTQMEVSEEIGISQAQVSRLEKGALSKIKS